MFIINVLLTIVSILILLAVLFICFIAICFKQNPKQGYVVRIKATHSDGKTTGVFTTNDLTLEEARAKYEAKGWTITEAKEFSWFAYFKGE
jgi:hypothetical protein